MKVTSPTSYDFSFEMSQDGTMDDRNGWEGDEVGAAGRQILPSLAPVKRDSEISEAHLLSICRK
jgi:hypothetical protein